MTKCLFKDVMFAFTINLNCECNVYGQYCHTVHCTKTNDDPLSAALKFDWGGCVWYHFMLLIGVCNNYKYVNFCIQYTLLLLHIGFCHTHWLIDKCA